MKPYEIGLRAALKKVAVYPEEYDSSGMLGGVAGGVAGAAAGGYAGGELGNHLGRLTRTHVLGVPIPFTGVGEHLFGQNTAQTGGEILGALGGGALGGTMGYHGGHLAALHRSAPPRVVRNGAVDPALMNYLMQQPR